MFDEIFGEFQNFHNFGHFWKFDNDIKLIKSDNYQQIIFSGLIKHAHLKTLKLEIALLRQKDACISPDKRFCISKCYAVKLIFCTHMLV